MAGTFVLHLPEHSIGIALDWSFVDSRLLSNLDTLLLCHSPPSVPDNASLSPLLNFSKLKIICTKPAYIFTQIVTFEGAKSMDSRVAKRSEMKLGDPQSTWATVHFNEPLVRLSLGFLSPSKKLQNIFSETDSLKILQKK